jgi:hypothetical protein
MSSSMPALLMTDIILEIFQYIDPQLTIAPALVQSTWTNLFLDKIWQKLSTLDGVFRILFTEEGDRQDNVSNFYIKA